MGYKCAECGGYIELARYAREGGDTPATSIIEAITPCGRRINIVPHDTTQDARANIRMSDLEISVIGGEGEHCNDFCSIGVGGFNNTETLSLYELQLVARERDIELV